MIVFPISTVLSAIGSKSRDDPPASHGLSMDQGGGCGSAGA
jgi:hypothetical protein